jgi:alkylresorcinol/alkylpyrone synthase
VPPTAQIVSLSTAVPPHAVAQSEVAQAAHRGFAGRVDDYERLARVFATSGILRRYAVKPLEWYFRPLGWPERSAAYLEGAVSLFVDSATRALGEAGLDAGAVDTVVTVSSTGIATPSLEAHVAGTMGLRADVERIPVFGLGCAGGVTGLAIAARLASARPGSVVLLVVIELCSLAFRLDKVSKENIVATALFGDGAAACVLCTDGSGIAGLEASGQHLWPETIDVMGWSVDPQGFGVIFDRAIPPFVETRLRAAVDGILERAGTRVGQIDRLAFHPGGTKVIAALERAFALPQGTLDHERAVLAEFGNMSAPTALFVLDRMIRAGLPARTLLTAMGPGFTASCVSLKRAA